MSMQRPLRTACYACIVLPLCLPPLSSTLAAHKSVPTLGPIPSNCPPTAHEQVVHGGSHVFGSSPVWAGIYGNAPFSDRQVGRIHLGPLSIHTRHGWGFKVLWWIEPSLASKVTIHGWHLGTGQRMWFNQEGNRPDGTPLQQKRSGIIDPTQATPDQEGWKFYPSMEYIPSAGCYVLFAQWKEGAWALLFAMGR